MIRFALMTLGAVVVMLLIGMAFGFARKMGGEDS